MFEGKPAATKEIPKVLGVSIVNTIACLWKDRVFARMCGTIPPSSLPTIVYGMWFFKDASVIAASFSIPPIIAQKGN